VGGTVFSALHQRKLHFTIFLISLECLYISQNQAELGPLRWAVLRLKQNG